MRRAAMFLIQIVALQPAANRPAGQGGRRRAGRCGRPQYLAMQGIRRLRHAAAQPVPCNADKRNYQAYKGGGVYHAFAWGCHNQPSYSN